jgi:hypothetical protein
MSRYKRYNKADDKLTRDLLDKNWSWPDIAVQLGRTAKSAQSRYANVRTGIAADRAEAPDMVRRDCNLCGSSVLMRGPFQRFCQPCRSHRVGVVSNSLGF